MSAEESAGPLLNWGVKRSFLDYILAVGGSCDTDGALFRAGRILFPPAQNRKCPRGRTDVVRHVGSVRMRAHGGLIDLTLADPAVAATADGVTLSVVARGPGMQGAEQRVVVALLGCSPGGLLDAMRSGRSLSSTLLSSGSWIFDHRYPVGIELAPVRWSATA
ncbi:HtaA domain-containing protein (plasmid) [Embleya sp. NBC_00888]|uniref:HtaA domain-containing protein n=1 Tax=Embleya sp. NBC_00888 TaxID=2975960 RepID=UPI002F91AA24|nr:HtaA domain-containing protein [Embleya sp. NBC_00888]